MAAEGMSCLLGSSLTLLACFPLLLLAVLAIAFKQLFSSTRTSLKQSGNLDIKQRDNGNVCSLLAFAGATWTMPESGQRGNTQTSKNS